MIGFKEGDFLKQVGGDAGIYYDGKTWIKFECVGCGYGAGVLKNRLPNGDHHFIWETHFGHTLADKGGLVLKHSAAAHLQWIRMGKPVRR